MDSNSNHRDMNKMLDIDRVRNKLNSKRGVSNVVAERLEQLEQLKRDLDDVVEQVDAGREEEPPRHGEDDEAKLAFNHKEAVHDAERVDQPSHSAANKPLQVRMRAAFRVNNMSGI